ncbi:hypothetical protein BGZ83_008029 [Gryganskiella cystojenkinii]|nr:hypothetical protein BGZ83_008029 [Gryganskiella cystojenkinii]
MSVKAKSWPQRLAILGLIILFGISNNHASAIPLQADGTSATALPSSKTLSSGTVLIPLKRLVPTSINPGAIVDHPASSTLFKKRALQVLDSSSTSTTTSPDPQLPSSISVTTVGRVGYAGHILIGSPPQRFPVLFDTGSDLALVISDRCQGTECPDLIQFSCSTSTTCVDLGASGLLGLDVGAGISKGHDSNSGSSNHDDDLTLQDTPADHSGSVASNGGAGLRAETSRMQQSPPPPLPQSQPSGSEPSEVSSASQEILKMQSAAKTTLPTTNQPPPLPILRRRHESINPTEDLAQVYSKVHVVGTDVSHANNLVDSNNETKHEPASSPRPNFYNQTYVDGSWGAGTFVQDQIQIDSTPMGQVYDPAAAASADATGASAPQPHLAKVTFLNVVQDNLGLASGYDHQISGLLGLTRASPTGRKTFLQELVEQKSLALPVVSMHLEIEGGSFLLGGIDHSQFRGDLIYCPVTDPVTWQISLRGMGTRPRTTIASNTGGAESTTSFDQGFGSSSTDENSGSAGLGGIKVIPQLSLFQGAPLILDSGTSSLLIPTAASETIHLELGGNWDHVHRTWFLPCEGTVDLIWWVSEGHGVVQPYESLIYKLEDGRCQSLIFGNPEANYWILGDTWLRGLYVVYDMAGSGRIGIAHATNRAISDGNQVGSVGPGGDSDTRILTFNNGASSRQALSSIVAIISLTIFMNAFFQYIFLP